MHALVQLATRMWLTANGKLEPWKERFVSSLLAAFPDGEYENWSTCQILFAHAKSAAKLKFQAESKPSTVQWATILHYATWYARRKRSGADAMDLAVKSMKALQKILGTSIKTHYIAWEWCLWRIAWIVVGRRQLKYGCRQ